MNLQLFHLFGHDHLTSTNTAGHPPVAKEHGVTTVVISGTGFAIRSIPLGRDAHAGLAIGKAPELAPELIKSVLSNPLVGRYSR